MAKTLEQPGFEQDEAEFQKPTQEQLRVLYEKLSRFPDLSDRISSIKEQIERIQHEAATKDDAPRLYKFLQSDLNKLNEELAGLPDSIEI